MQESDSLMEMYDQGLLTRGELVNKLMALAATIHPSDYVARLPPDLRQEIKDNHYVQKPPVSPQEVFSIEPVCYKPGIDQVAAADQRRQQRSNALRSPIPRQLMGIMTGGMMSSAFLTEGISSTRSNGRARRELMPDGSLKLMMFCSALGRA